MENSILNNKKFQLTVRLITAVSFTLFVVYQILLVIQIEENRIGRLIGIGMYLLITVASYLDFSDRYGVWIAHSIVFVAGLLLLFIMRMFNLIDMIGQLDFSSIPSILNCLVYIFSQLGILVLVAGYLVLKNDLTQRQTRKLETVLMTIVIVLFVLCFICECVLLIVYHLNIDIRIRYTLPGRVLYCLGYVGSAISLLLPAPEREIDEEEEQNSGQILYSDDDSKEVDVII